MIDIAKKALEDCGLFIWTRDEFFMGQWVYGIFVRAEKGTYTFTGGRGISEGAAVMMLVVNLADPSTWDYRDEILGRLEEIEEAIPQVLSHLFKELSAKKDELFTLTQRTVEGNLQNERNRIADMIDGIDDKLYALHEEERGNRDKTPTSAIRS